MRKHLLLLAGLLFSLISIAQVRDIPKTVKDSFEKRYPGADSVSFEDNLLQVNVSFRVNGERMQAQFSNKGEWKQTSKELGFDVLPPEVVDGFNKSKYSESEWKVIQSDLIHLPGGAEQYRIRIEKNELQKKYLFFNTRGRMIREALTI